jgi:murein DD-endopeptidase MepM/ murein hydrolase activator NlpD
VVVAIVAGALACHSARGLRHRVEPGETLYRIGLAYGVSHQMLAQANGIDNADRIEVGQVLVIPDGKKAVPVRLVTPERARGDRPAPSEVPTGAATGAVPFLWPVEGGVLTSSFGPRDASHHDGIDISAPAGTPVRVARDGLVLYSDTLRGYGNLIIVEHDGGYATVYAHNRENRADRGDVVRQGDAIATVGETGKTSGPNLHFEIRKDNVARNPVFYLPEAPRRASVVQRGL